MTRLTVLALAAILGTGSATAQDAAAGRALAEEHCARCHDIEPGGANKTFPPSLASIAWFRDDGQIEARIWTPQMHSAMPDWSLVLTREGVADLVAYIRSLD